MSACPSPDVLRRLSSGTFGDVTETGLDEHLNGCLACQEALERLIREPGDLTGTAAARVPGPEMLPEIPDLVMERELGRGGMGVVYQAWDPRLLRHVAVKIVLSGPMAGMKERKRWLQEARSLTRVRDPHVVHLLHVGEADGWLFLVLEHVGGKSLAERVRGPLTPRDSVELLLPVVSAVEAIHKAGLLHLDLKPSNILLDSTSGAPWKDVFPKVTDFGIARPLADGDLTSTTLAGPFGSPPYMAPEQAMADRKAIGPPTDIHALGAILYELLTGRPPFQGASPLETLDQVRTQDPVPPRRLNPRVPRDLESITLKCLEKAPSKRYAVTGALADDLQRWLDGRPIHARPVSGVERAWRWCRRRPVVAALTATLALSLSLGFLSIALLWRRAEAERRRAEADARTTEEFLNQIVEQSLPGNEIQSFNLDSLIPTLEQTRRRLLQVTASRSGNLGLTRQQALLDKVLAQTLIQKDRNPDAIRLYLNESLRCLQYVLRREPNDPEAWAILADVFGALAEVSDTAKRPAEALVYRRQSVGAGEEYVRIQPSAISFCALASIRNQLAGVLARRGDLVQARSVMAANRRMFEHIPAEAENPDVAAWRVFVRMEFDRFGETSASTSTDLSLSEEPGHPAPLAELASPAADRLSAQDWAELATQALRAAAPPGTPVSHEAEAGYRLIIPLGVIGAEQRHCGKLDEARRTASRMLALGQLLVARYPSLPAAHLSLSEGYTAMYKNAWQTDDMEAVERNMRLALDAALQAQSLDPTNGWARSLVDRRQRGLKELLSGRAASK
jgi:serine/threonine protein kinase